jgi:serine/threonine-protein kinase
MSYCINPSCTQPTNLTHADICRACGSKLLLRDRYRVLEVLGRGRFSVTFLAQDESKAGELSCAIKQLRPATTESPLIEIGQKLFEREADTLRKIGNHPQVPQLLDYFQDNHQFYMVQEYINGWTLHQEIKQGGPLSQAGVKQFLSEILPLLEFIHSQQLIHRDIKPTNLMRDEQNRKLVLIDFGAVKNCQGVPDNILEETTWTDISIGTPGFAPPEQILMRPVFASDIYALGVTCIFLLTGKSPKKLGYNPLTSELVWKKYVQISDHFTEVLNKMLEASVRYRYQSAGDILNSLDCIGREPDLNSSTNSCLLPPFATETLFKLDANSLLKAYMNGERDFTAEDLSGLDLHKSDLSKAIFYRAKLAKTNFEGANLSNADFSQASLKQANLRHANLGGADFYSADLEGADLRGANLSFAYLNHANLKAANLCSANLSKARITEAQLTRAKKNWATVLPSGKCGLC